MVPVLYWPQCFSVCCKVLCNTGLYKLHLLLLNKGLNSAESSYCNWTCHHSKESRGGRERRGGGKLWAHGSETCLTHPNLQRLEREVVKGFRVYRYNGAERIRGGFTEPLWCPSSLGVHSQSTFVGLTNGTSHERSERTNPFLMMQGKFHWPWLSQCIRGSPLSHTPCQAFKLCSQASVLRAFEVYL